jgi:membrane protein YqaA with SNARE-associated domain
MPLPGLQPAALALSKLALGPLLDRARQLAATPAAILLAANPQHAHKFLHLLASFGVLGIFLVSIVDSSFVPLPVPGVTDIMLVLFAAQKTNWLLLIALASAGSALGGLFSYQVGQHGGMVFLERHVPPLIFKRIRHWMESNAILAVALPALLPPPMPLSPFVLAAGALKMSRNKFLTTFTVSRCLRHSIAVLLGVHYGRQVLHLWNAFSAKWATTILSVLWSVILLSCAIAFWKLYKTWRSVGIGATAVPEDTNVAS